MGILLTVFFVTFSFVLELLLHFRGKKQLKDFEGDL